MILEQIQMKVKPVVNKMGGGGGGGWKGGG